jgi:hypothetical protein
MYEQTQVGIVVDQHGALDPDGALAAWNENNPSYQGDSSASAPFILV